MDAHTIRDHLAQVDRELSTLDAQRDALLAVKRGYETLLRLHADEAAAPARVRRASPAVPPAAASQVAPAPAAPADAQDGETPTSLRRAVADVLRASGPAPISSQVVLDRARELGGRTDSKEPLATIDQTIRRLVEREGLPVKKVGFRLWRWSGDSGEEAGPGH